MRLAPLVLLALATLVLVALGVVGRIPPPTKLTITQSSLVLVDPGPRRHCRLPAAAASSNDGCPPRTHSAPPIHPSTVHTPFFLI